MRKQYLAISGVLAFLFLSIQVAGQVVISEIGGSFSVELKNIGTDTVNVDQYWLCNRPSYERIGSLQVECGSFNMAPGSILTLTTNQVELTPSGGELGVYLSGEDFTDAQSMVDYVIWGDRGATNTREPVAVTAGIWTLGERAPAYSTDQSEALYYDGDGDAAADYFLGQATFCMDGFPCAASGGQLSIANDGGASIDICVGDGISDAFDVVVDSAQGSNTAWVITDTAGVILGLPMAPPFDFDSTATGICLVWHIAFEDTLTGVALGANASDITGCFALSNSISVNRLTGADCPSEPCNVDGGSIATQDSLTDVTICTDDDVIELVTVELNGATGPNNTWVVTDTSLNILSIDSNNVFALESLGVGVCLIWHLSYEDGLGGAAIDSNAANLSGCFDLSNSIRVTKLSGADCLGMTCEVDGGSIVAQNNETSISICIDDNDEDLVFANVTGAIGTNSALVVTDISLNILAIETNTNVFSLEPLGEGVCLIWNLSYEDGLQGAIVGANAADLTGCFALSNSLTVNRLAGSDCNTDPCEVMGGQLSISGGATSIEICAGDDESDAFDVVIDSAQGANMAWVVTDTNGIILALPTAPPFDLEDAGAGVCFLWHLVFDGEISGVALDLNANDISGCFALSNPITVTRVTGADCPAPPCDVSGGSIVTQDSLTIVSICVDDSEADLIEASASGQSGSNSAWVVTDTSLTILSIDSSNVFDLSSTGAGVCLIWHISYEDGLEGAAVDSNASNLEGCFSLSNSITVTKLAGADCPVPPCDVSGGSIVTQDSLTIVSICVDDNETDLIEASVSGQSGSNSAWVVTDTSLTILSIDSSNVFDLSSTGAGVCLIWHISYEDGLEGAAVDSNASNLSGCFSLSNSITVTKLAGADCPAPPCDVSGGSIVTQDSLTSVSICVDDSEADLIEVSVSGQSGSNSAWVVTDTSLTILSIDSSNVFDLSSTGAGVCLIWHISYEDGLEGAEIDSSASNLVGCFSLSNSITVTKLAGADCPAPPCDVSGGSIVTQDSLTSVSICVDDNEVDIIEVSVSGQSGSNSAWVVTDTSLTILSIDSSNVFDLSSSGAGVCLIWHISYEDGLEGAAVDSNASNLMGCFSLSNSITVTKLSGADCPTPPCDVSGGSIVTQDSLTSVSICVDDNETDLIEASVSGQSGSNSAWVVTDTNLTILSIDSSNVFDLSSSGAGVCLIWHISYEDGLEGAEVDSSASNLAGCFSLSNSITVTKLAGDDCPTPACDVSGGTIDVGDGSTEVTICIDDDEVDLIEANLNGQTGANSIWVVTDTSLNILALDINNTFDLESLGTGVCLIWHLSYEDSLVGATIGGNAMALEGCFSLSNSITVIRVAGDDCGTSSCDVAGGMITAAGEVDLTICLDDETELIEVSLTGQVGSTSIWVVTDTSLNILTLDSSNVFDFESTGPGVCLIWHLSYEDGLMGAAVDSNAANLEGCFALSNSIRVTRLAGDDCPVDDCSAIGGRLTSNGSTEVVVCGNSDGPFDVTLEDAVGSRSAWVITDTEGLIIGFPLSPPFNLSTARVGTYQIWHLSFEGAIMGAGLGGNISNLEGCFGLSNPLTVHRVDVLPSTISFADNTTSQTLCIGEMSQEVDVVVSRGEGTLSWVITDTTGVIIGLPETAPFDFGSAGPGVCLIWAINHGPDLDGLTLGENAGDLSGCFVLSNALTVVRNVVNGGQLVTPIGTAEIEICVGDSITDNITLSLTEAAGANTAYVVTDTSGAIIGISDALDFNFEEVPAGVCNIWHIAYSDGLEGLAPGILISELSGCFDLSNPVTLTRLSGDDCPAPCGAEGGQLSDLEGGTEITICVDDGISDAFDLMVTGAVGENSGFVITDDENNILGIEDEFRANFDGTGAGEILVRYITYDDDANIPEEGGNINTLSGCFALSNIFTIHRVVGDNCFEICAVDGGVITAEGGDTLEICSDDGVSDELNVTLTDDSGDNSVYVITDAAANILALVDTGSFDFEGTGPGTCLFWHLSYQDSISGLEEGGNANDLSGCFDLSNPITIIRSTGNDCPGACTTDGGSVAVVGGENTELEFCAGDVFFSVTHDTEDSSNTYWYVITDEDGRILEWRNSTEGGDFDLSRAPGGVCLLYGYSAIDGSLLMEGIAVTDLEDDCGALSSNYITITRNAGGECDEGCHVPRDIRIRRTGGTSNRWSIQWDRVGEARGYIVLVGYEDSPASFSEVPVRRNRLTLTGPPNRVIVIRVKTVCGFGASSEFSREIRLVDDGSNAQDDVSQSRSLGIQHGTRLPSGIIISEQALAFPNPAAEQITIWYAAEGIEGSLSIFDQTGRRVITRSIDGKQDLYDVDISELNDGFYFILVESQGEILMQDKLIKSNMR